MGSQLRQPSEHAKVIPLGEFALVDRRPNMTQANHNHTLCVRQVRSRAVQAPLEYTLKTSTGVIATVPLVLIDIEKLSTMAADADHVVAAAAMALSSVFVLGNALRLRRFAPSIAA